jgi:ABC-type phosphate transport system permease subunit
VLAWAAAQGGAAAWTVAAVATALVVAGAVVKYVVPTRRLHEAGIPARTQWAGVGLAVVGFFVVPVIGLPLGFVLGIYLAELARVGSERAWPATVQSLRAVGLSVLIELAAALLAAGVWVVGVVAT